MVEREYSFLLEVKVWDEEQNCLEFSDNLIRMVIDWYDRFTDSAYSNIDYYGQKLHPIEKNRFMMTYRTINDERVPTFEEMMADPDDDGNYPLKINGTLYLVGGKVISEEDPKA